MKMDTEQREREGRGFSFQGLGFSGLGFRETEESLSDGVT